MDDGSGWHEVLLASWNPQVRAAVVDRIERASLGARGPLIRAVAAPDAARYAWTEQLHRLVLAAIRAETGADLDELGSQAAWACYEEVWDELARTWGTGQGLAKVPLGAEPAVVRDLQQLPALAAEHAGADVSGVVADPLWLGGRLLVDTVGLRAYVGRCTEVSDDVRRRVDRILAACGDC